MWSGTEGLKKKAAELWQQIVTLETEKYDLEERSKRQDYDVSFKRSMLFLNFFFCSWLFKFCDFFFCGPY